MKSLDQQIYFLDQKLLPLYGFQSIADYETIINVQILQNKPTFLDLINEILLVIIDIYPVKKFNLHKTDHKIQSHLQAFNILVQCLEISEIPHTLWTETHNRKTIRYLRLFRKNKKLEMYIEKMAEKRSFNKEEMVDSGSKKEKELMTNDDLLHNVKEYVSDEIRFPLFNNRKHLYSQSGCEFMQLKCPEFGSDFSLVHEIEISLTNDNRCCCLGNKCLSSICLSLTNDSIDLYDQITYTLVTNDRSIKNKLIPYQNILPNNIILPCQIINQTIKLVVRIQCGFKIKDPQKRNLQLVCQFTEALFSRNMIEKMSNSMIQLPFTSELNLVVQDGDTYFKSVNTQNLTSIKSDNTQKFDVDWNHINDSPHSNHEYIYYLLKKDINEIDNFPFIKVDKIGRFLMAFCHERQIQCHSLITLLHCKFQGQPLNYVGSHHEESMNYQYYIHKNMLIIHNVIQGQFDTINNLMINFDKTIDREIEIKITQSGETKLKFNKINENTFKSLLNEHQHFNLKRQLHYYREYEVCITIPLKQDECFENLLGKINLSYDGYAWDTDNRRKLMDNKKSESIIDMDTF